MQRLPVESSDIVSIGYNPAERLLEVEFQGGRIYHYRDVEPDIHAQFMRADSYGTFFFAYINGRYRYQKASATEGEDSSSGRALAFVGGTSDELQSLQAACRPYDIAIESLDVPADEIQSDDAENVTLKKAKQAYKVAGRPLVVTTTFWNILTLHGFPGPYAQPIARWLSVEDLQNLLKDKSDRTVSMTRTLAYYDSKRHKFFKQDYWGALAEEPRGSGNALERLTILSGQAKTLAELREKGQPVWIPKENAWQEFAQWLRLQRRLEMF
jgi:inosine/xanthosine triphosphate pyrophosphatase family protein